MEYGTHITAAGAFIVAAGISAYHFMGKVWETIGASLKVIIKTTAVWAGVLVLVLGGFWLGYIEGASGKRALRTKITGLETANDQLALDAKAAEKRAAAAVEDAKGWRLKAEGKAAEESRQGSSVAAVPRRAVAKAPEKKEAASAPAKGVWWPFAN